MTGLIAADVRRLQSRRLARLALAVFVAGILVAAVASFVTSSKDPDAARERAAREVAACERERALFEQAEGPQPGFGCPTVEELIPHSDPRFRYAENMLDGSRALAIAAMLGAVALGASFVGAEWGTGAMTTLLTWEPRRGRVLVSKLVAGAVVCAAAAVGLIVLLCVVNLPAGTLRGSMDGLTGRWWGTLTGVGGRAAALAVLGSTIGIGLATITRNTAGAVGSAFVYGAIIDPILGAWREGRLRPWLLQRNLAHFMGVPVTEAPQGATGVLQPPAAPTLLRPALLLALYAAAVACAGYALFRSRDVT